MWSIGVMAYEFLAGRLPFKVKGSSLDMASGGKLDFEEKTWQSVSAHAKDFILRLLEKDPKIRFTAMQALGHPWIRLYYR
ncbi:hypothetical protein R1flu_014140 [Riccia fluitans]|uniref:Protein kinase domain-containing protein n=1 Tax=Riccia fluitans TaxID=41844 RepID=A0ABD1YIP2_9MARC